MEKRMINLAPADLKKVKRASDIICEELENNLTVTYIARKVGLEPRRLCRYYRKVYHMSIRTSIMELKGAEACQILLRNKQSFTDTAHELGYATYQGFARMFKNYTGLCPSHWLAWHLAVPRFFPWIFKHMFPEEGVNPQ
ncbi:hypothetical protein A3860_30480 [Niastella vici]|uniref:HTH araC/xylS-type domain-containing protein n=1 Tax=Niastella vici TaxID=1703345 RepID=A0A1V9FUI1_9BACT|nr:AraC family transcriptional regulator [Niastella vici]OQP62013.1 hypothetical protein A3860_30480 [Niastella vici]